MTEEELNAQVQAAQDEIVRLRETFGPAYAKLGEALYPVARETELAARFADEFAEVDAINAAIDEQNAAIEAARAEYEAEQARIAEEAARAAEEAARAEAEAAAAEVSAEEQTEPADESAVENEPVLAPEPEPFAAPAPAPAPAEVRTCPKCGTTLQPTDKFCAGCGSKVADLFAPVAPHCPNCGKEVDESMNFCIYCGIPLK